MVQETHSRPSAIAGVQDELAAYLFDSAVVTFGTIIDNLREERIKVGPKGHEEWQHKYTLPQLLESSFRVVPEKKVKPFTDGLSTVLSLAGKQGSGVKQWVYVPPSNGEEKVN